MKKGDLFTVVEDGIKAWSTNSRYSMEFLGRLSNGDFFIVYAFNSVCDQYMCGLSKFGICEISVKSLKIIV
jgi:hypothetical protein